MANFENKNLESESKKGLTKDVVDNFTSENFDKVMDEIQKSNLSSEVQQGGPKGNKDAKDFIQKGYISLVANHLDDYKGLDSEVANALIKNGYIEAMKSHLNSFVCDKKLVILLIKNDWKLLQYYIDLFKDIPANEIVNLCIEYKCEQRGIMHIFEVLAYTTNDIFDKNVAKNLVEAADGRNCYIMTKFIDRFHGLDKEIAEILINKWRYVNFVLNNLDKFEGLDKGIAEILIQEGKLKNVAMNINRFHGLDREIAEIFIQEGYLKNVVENKDTFNQEGKEFILDFRKKNNYRMAKDIDGKIKPSEEIIDRIISNVELPSGKKLSVSDVKYIGGEYDIKGFELIVTREDLKKTQLLRIFIDKNSGKETFQIPGLEGLKFKDKGEIMRVVNLLIWLRRNKYEGKNDSKWSIGKYQWAGGELERDAKFLPIDVDILKKSAIDKYYPSIKNSQEFLDYINSEDFK